jgi:hypothetical protein
MTQLYQVAAIAAIAGTGVVYGTDVFCAIAQRPALARVDDAALTAVMGNVHRFADRRMPAPGVLGIAAAGAAAGLAANDGRTAPAAAASSAFLLLAGWLALYLRISAPINRTLTAAADAGRTPPDARALQRDWDRIIVPRAALLALAVLALCTTLIA